MFAGDIYRKQNDLAVHDGGQRRAWWRNCQIGYVPNLDITSYHNRRLSVDAPRFEGTPVV